MFRRQDLPSSHTFPNAVTLSIKARIQTNKEKLEALACSETKAKTVIEVPLRSNLSFKLNPTPIRSDSPSRIRPTCIGSVHDSNIGSLS